MRNILFLLLCCLSVPVLAQADKPVIETDKVKIKPNVVVDMPATSTNRGGFSGITTVGNEAFIYEVVSSKNPAKGGLLSSAFWPSIQVVLSSYAPGQEKATIAEINFGDQESKTEVLDISGVGDKLLFIEGRRGSEGKIDIVTCLRDKNGKELSVGTLLTTTAGKYEDIILFFKSSPDKKTKYILGSSPIKKAKGDAQSAKVSAAIVSEDGTIQSRGTYTLSAGTDKFELEDFAVTPSGKLFVVCSDVYINTTLGFKKQVKPSYEMVVAELIEGTERPVTVKIQPTSELHPRIASLGVRGDGTVYVAGYAGRISGYGVTHTYIMQDVSKAGSITVQEISKETYDEVGKYFISGAKKTTSIKSKTIGNNLSILLKNGRMATFFQPAFITDNSRNTTGSSISGITFGPPLYTLFNEKGEVETSGVLPYRSGHATSGGIESKGRDLSEKSVEIFLMENISGAPIFLYNDTPKNATRSRKGESYPSKPKTDEPYIAYLDAKGNLRRTGIELPSDLDRPVLTSSVAKGDNGLILMFETKKKRVIAIMEDVQDDLKLK